MSPAKLKRCVRKVKAAGTARDPWAVCVKATGQKPHSKGNPHPHRRKAPPRKRRKKKP